MKRTVKWLAFLVLLPSLVGVWSDHANLAAQPRQQIGVQTVTSMYTGADGLTHFKEIEIPHGQLIRLKGGLVFGRHALEAPNTPRRFGNAPHRRFVVTLSGAAEIVASSGERFVADSRHILLAEDLTGKGHSTQAVPPEDWVRLFLEIDEPQPRSSK